MLLDHHTAIFVSTPCRFLASFVLVRLEAQRDVLWYVDQLGPMFLCCDVVCVRRSALLVRGYDCGPTQRTPFMCAVARGNFAVFVSVMHAFDGLFFSAVSGLAALLIRRAGCCAMKSTNFCPW